MGAKGSGRGGGTPIITCHTGLGAWSVLQVAVAAAVVVVALKADVSEGAGGRGVSLCIERGADW